MDQNPAVNSTKKEKINKLRKLLQEFQCTVNDEWNRKKYFKVVVETNEIYPNQMMVMTFVVSAANQKEAEKQIRRLLSHIKGSGQTFVLKEIEETNEFEKSTVRLVKMK
ncbi:hypothetical protein [Fictibacillus gelatini]|uniref:hypothetical protein n=1 Tax=Fictibacillus gelatini TaxID=225985 RepID=UPI0004109DF9|nr:hypothetical protein [Fictibacillus gelatini]